LQTERDKARVLEGLEGASVAAQAGFDKGKLDRMLSGLSQRVFLMNNVHEDAPVVFESRWAMSYLRGPLTRDQIKKLMDGKRPAAAAASRASTGTAGSKSDAVAESEQRSREQRDLAVEKLRAQYAPKLHKLEERARNAEQAVQREEGQARGAQLQTVISAGATILTALLGRKRISYTSVGRATTAARGAQRAMQQQQDVKAAKEDLAAAHAEYERLEQELAAKIAEIQAQR
jgi:hypothetical protein